MNKITKALLLLAIILVFVFLLVRNPDKSLEELLPFYTDDDSQWVEIGGIDVHYKKEGKGSALLLIHGTGASLHTWDKWTALLKDSFTIYRMDLPAFGLTGPAINRDYSIGAYVRFIDDFVKSRKLSDFAIAGNSLGGYIAWAYAWEHPETVKKLVLLDAAGYPHMGASRALVFRIAQNPLLGPLLKHITPKSFIRKNLEQVYSNDSKITENLVRRYHDMTLRSGNRQAFLDRAKVRQIDISDRISRISCPTLIMWGADDTWTDVNDAKKFKKDIPNSDIIMYDHVGHVPMEEIPERSARDVRKFLLK